MSEGLSLPNKTFCDFRHFPSKTFCDFRQIDDSGKLSMLFNAILAELNKVCPIEVKSSGYSTHASLNAFCNKYSNRVQNRYLLYSKDIKNEGGVQYLPFYMTMFL